MRIFELNYISKSVILFYFQRVQLALLSLAFIGCGQKIVSNSVSNASCSSRVSVAYTGTAEKAYCSTPIVYASPVTITGTATYETRAYTPANGLSSSLTTNPIRRAEVAVYNSSNQIVQCGETDNSGNFSLDLGASSSTYTVKINSRAANTYLNASVLNCPEENVPYTISSTFTPDSSKSIGTINADSANTGTLKGAAFNILDQFLNSNDFMRTEAGTCTSTHATCIDFTAAPKVKAYWVKGFNPNDYYGSTSGLSFYLPGYHHLFILGGVSGDIYNSDTDHFDNSVIIHEYGHFLEDVYTITDSPGGQHSANSIIDPRLAWSEGWGNFIQAAVRNEPHYRDTSGTPNAASPISTSSYVFNIPTETESGSCSIGSTAVGCDLPEFASEGNFREFSITRMLWDIFDSVAGGNDTDTDGVNDAFVDVWASLTSTLGFLNTNNEFRNIGLLNDIQTSVLTGSTDLSSLKTTHKEAGSGEYAQYVTRQAGCLLSDNNGFALTPYNDPNDNGSYGTSHLVRNNDFFYYHHTGGSFSLSVTARVDGGGVYEPDVDLYLYNSSARFGVSADMTSKSDNYWDNNPATDQTESFVISNLAAGNYLINVKLYTGRYAIDANSSTINCIGSGAATICENDPGPNYNYIPAGDPIHYQLLLNGVSLCTSAVP
jgi:hypothetical protein